MLYLIFKTTILSIIFISVLHYLYNFFKTNLTIPKTKDLINKPKEKYDAIFETIKQTNSQEPKGNNTNNNNNSGDKMKNELKDYLKQQMNSVKTKTEFNGFNSTGNYYEF